MEKQKSIPVLRFPEYTGEWERKKIEDVAQIKYGKDQKQVVCKDGKYPILGTGGEMGRTDEFLCNKPSVLIGRKGTIDKPRYMDSPFWTVDTLFYTDIFPITNPKWLFYKFETINWYLYNEASGVPSLSGSTIYKIPIKTPTLPEQQKIATFLTSVDSKLTQLKLKKCLLEQYKKGVMQKIFSQEIRFKDENEKEYPEWEEMRFGDIFSFRTTNSFSRDNLNYENGDVLNIHYGDIHTKFHSHFDVTKENVPFVNRDISLNKLSIDSYCKEGDLIIADASEDYADIGKSIEIVNLNDKKVIAGLHTLHARPNLHKMSLGFSGFLMKSPNVRLQIKTLAQGTKVLSISTGRLSTISLSIPCLAEQTKIAIFLSAFDDKISHCSAQIEKMEMWKKGLLQQMFC